MWFVASGAWMPMKRENYKLFVGDRARGPILRRLFGQPGTASQLCRRPTRAPREGQQVEEVKPPKESGGLFGSQGGALLNKPVAGIAAACSTP